MTTIIQDHYLEHLQHFNDHAGSATLTADIRNNQNVLLIAKGERLNPKNSAILLKHKLQKSIDNYICIEPLLSPKTLLAKLKQQLELHEDVNQIVIKFNTLPSLLPLLVDLTKFPLIYHKLTIMAETIPAVFHRSLINALIGVTLATQQKYEKPDIFKILMITLAENIGYLYLTPELSKNLTLNFDLMKDYIVHPIISEQVLKSSPGIPPSILKAVKQHHERVDGTGFPEMLTGKEISTLVSLTSLVDELVHLKFSSEDENQPFNLMGAFALLQFRRSHFNNALFSGLQALIIGAGINNSCTISDLESASFAQLQLVYFAKCLVFCEVLARVVEICNLSDDIKPVKRLHSMCQGFFKSLFESGMLSQAIKRFIEEIAKTSNAEPLQDLYEIHHAHKGILSRINEIICFIQFTAYNLKSSNKYENHPILTGLQSCLEYIKHIQAEKNKSPGWQSLIDNLCNKDHDLSSILNSIQVSSASNK